MPLYASNCQKMYGVACMNFPAVWSEIRRILVVTGEKRLSGISIVIVFVRVHREPSRGTNLVLSLTTSNINGF